MYITECTTSNYTVHKTPDGELYLYQVLSIVRVHRLDRKSARHTNMIA